MAKIILIPLMKKTLSKVGFRLRALRHSRRWTQETLAAACQARGFAVTRAKLAKYEIGLAEVPAHFIPIFAHVLKVDITDLLPPIGGKSNAQHSSARTIFHDKARPKASADTFSVKPPSQKSQHTRRKDGFALNPFTYMAHKLGKFVKRLISHH